MIIAAKIATLMLCVSCGIDLKAQDADAIIGTYLIDEGDSKVEIFRSSNGISGKVVWLKKEESGDALIFDDKNDDASLRARRVMGLVVFEGLQYKNGKWSGNIYSPRKGKSYDASFAMNDDSGDLNLKIKVYFLTISRYWTKQ